MSIAIKVRQVQKVFEQLDAQIRLLQSNTGIYCLPGCGHCCTKPNIEATVLEFLPFAFEVFLRREHHQIKAQIKLENQGRCHHFSPLSLVSASYQSGRCTQYQFRGLICRLFGYATVRNKLNNKTWSSCQPIKNNYPEAANTMASFIEKKEVPDFVNYYQKLVQIDFKLGQEYLPINDALIRAIEEVEHYYQYRPFPYRHLRLGW